uniref:Uncharacterized protein n=1 Tax=viral metagenome TaxID=1070528 RepID=A0A6C0H9F7_9ZZZZ
MFLIIIIALLISYFCLLLIYGIFVNFFIAQIINFNYLNYY